MTITIQSSPADIIRRLAAFLSGLELWGVGLLVLVSVIKPAVLPIAVGGAAFFVLIRWTATGHIIVRTPFEIPIGVLGMMLVVSAWITARPEITHLQILRVLTGIALFYALVNWTDSPQKAQWLLWGTAGIGLGLSAVGLISVEWITGKLTFLPAFFYSRLPQLLADTVHPNVLAGTILPFIPLPLALLSTNWRELHLFEKLLYALSVLVSISMIIFTQSRGGLIGLGVGWLVLLPFLWKRKGWMALGGTMGLVLAVVLYLGPSILLGDQTAASTVINTLPGRLEAWQRALYMIRDFPFTGIGMGLYGPVVDNLYPFLTISPGEVPHAHNLFLQVAVDLGLPGFVAWIAIMVLAIKTAFQIWQRADKIQNKHMAAVGAGLLAGLIALCAHGFFDAVTWGMVRTAPLVWAYWGLIIAIERTTSEENYIGRVVSDKILDTQN